MSETRFTVAGGHRLEYAWHGRGHRDQPAIVMLHEGLGSVALWRDFPQRLAAAAERRVLVYSRYGYGRSDPLTGPRRVDFMHLEALQTLPELLDALEIGNPVLFGHSDGGSIALIHAARSHRPVSAVVALAPHVFVEDISIASITEARRSFETTDLRARLARRHADADAAFRGWNDIWLSPAFRSWNIETSLPGIRCPLLLIQGRDDEYGTPSQLDAIESQVGGKLTRIELDDCGHAPQRDQPQATLEAIADFVATLPP